MSRLVAIAAVLASQFGCTPYVTSYIHLDAPEVKLVRTCGDASPPYLATYEGSGARFSVTLEPWAGRSKAGYLRVVAPESVVVAVRNPTGHIERLDQPSAEPIQFRLERVEHWEDRFAREMFRRRGSLLHQYDFVGLPPIDFPGKLRLPPIFVNGVAVPSPELKFERRPYMGVAPLNC